MRALTVRQPWAWAIVHGGKNVENRDWKPRVAPEGRIAIHAAARDAGDYAWPFVAERTEPFALTADLVRGAIVGTAELADIHQGSSSARGWCKRPECAIWGMAAAYHWVLTDARPLVEPIPCRGSLGLWALPASLEDRVRADWFGVTGHCVQCGNPGEYCTCSRRQPCPCSDRHQVGSAHSPDALAAFAAEPAPTDDQEVLW